MTDTVTVFNALGQKLGELPGVIIQRSKKAERSVDAAAGNLTVSITDSFANLTLLQYMNFIFVQSDQDGIEDWCGIIYGDDNGIIVQNGMIQIPLKECTYLLNTVWTDNVEQLPSSTPGNVFIYLIHTAAQRNASIPVIATDVTGIDRISGDASAPLYNRANIYEAANKLASDGDYFWWFTPKRDPVTDNLLLYPVWRLKQGAVFSSQLVERPAEYADSTGAQPKGNFTVYSYAERVRAGYQMATRVQAYGKFDDWKKPLLSPWIIDATLENAYGKTVEWVEPSIASTTLGQLYVAATRALRNRHPRLYVVGIVTSSPYPRLGDTCPVVLTDTGAFLQTSRGSLINMRVLLTTYAPDGSGLTITLEEILSGE